jgi:hypothetical protein
MSELTSFLAETFSLTQGGPLYWLLVRMRLAGSERHRVINRTLLTVVVTWLPLLALSLLQSQAYGSDIAIPFLRDFAVNVRFLVALPILILVEMAIDRRWRLLVLEFLRSGLVDEKELPSFEAAIQKTARLRDSVLPEVVLIAAALLPSLFQVNTELLMGDVSSWHTVGLHFSEVSMAGWWFNIVSMPVFRFLLFRWLWRMFLWSAFLWRVSRLNLYLIATHTDLAAGLGFLSEGQKACSPLVFAGGAVVAASIGNAIAYAHQTLWSLKFAMIAYGVIAIIILVAPLLVVVPVLLKVKKKALLEYGALVTNHNQLFDRKWIRKEEGQGSVILGNEDPSSLIDLGSSFAVIRQMGVVPIPIDRQTLLALAAAAALPMVIVVLLVTPADQLIREVMKMLG